MDLVQGAKPIIVIMDHVNKYGESKVKKNCSLPLTGKGVVHCLITELGVFCFNDGKMELIELQQGVTLDEVQNKTEAEFTVNLFSEKLV